MKVLLVDDEETIVLGIKHHLEQLEDVDLEVVCANSGEKALETVDFFHPDLMIVDIRMPDMDGLELIEMINRSYFCDNIIILSAYPSFEYAQRAIEDKVKRYMLKPVSYEALDEVVRGIAGANERKLNISEILKQYDASFVHIRKIPSSSSLQQIAQYIQNNYAKQISLARIAQLFHVSESRICLLFKNELSTSFVVYLSELRIRKALELLLAEPDLGVDQIAYRVGYQTNRQLFRLFQKYLGMSPMNFREHWLGK